MMQHQLTTPHDEVILAKNAAVIRALGKRVVGDVIEIGRRLAECKQHVRHGNWLQWLEQELGWGDDTAERFIQLHKLSGQFPQIAEYDIPVSSLYLLAAPSTSDDVRTDVIDRAANGESMTHAQVKEMIEDARKKQDAEHQQELKRKIAALHEQADRQIAEMRAELDLSLTPDKVADAIEDALTPLKKKIERYEKALEKQKTRVTVVHAAEVSAISGALRHLAASLTITPKQFMSSQQHLANLTQQKLGVMVGDDLSNAKSVIGWLRGLIKELESEHERKEPPDDT